MINAQFIECLAKFGAARGSYQLLVGKDKDADAEMSKIYEDAVKNPFSDIASAAKELGAATKQQIADLASVDDPTAIAARLILLPFRNLIQVLEDSTISKEGRDKIRLFMEEQGLALSLLDSTKFMGMLLVSALQGIATIKHQRKILNNIDNKIKYLIDHMGNMPEFNAPFHPFDDTISHLENAKRSFTEVRNIITKFGKIDKKTFGQGQSELIAADTSITGGTLGEAVASNIIKDIGIGDFVSVKNINGQTSFMNAQQLSATSFLPNGAMFLNSTYIKEARNQVAVYNANLEATLTFVREFVDGVLTVVDMKRFFGVIFNFLLLEIKAAEDTLTGQATVKKNGVTIENSAGTLEAQGEGYFHIQLLIQYANMIKSGLERFNANDINNTGWLKNIRNVVAKFDLSECVSSYKQLDANIGGFLSAYQKRYAFKVSNPTVINMGNRARASIKNHLVYLDCIESHLNNLGLNKLDQTLLDGMAWAGSALAFITSFSGISWQDFIKGFNPKAALIAQMDAQLDCMKNSCSSAAVQSIITKLKLEFGVLNKLFKSNTDLNQQFTNQSRFAKQYRENRLTQAIEQFIAAVNKLTC